MMDEKVSPSLVGRPLVVGSGKASCLTRLRFRARELGCLFCFFC